MAEIARFGNMKHLISKEGFEKFKAEWEQLKYVERPAMINQVQAAAAEVDRILDGAQIIECKPTEDGSIRFGATVKLVDKKTRREKTYSIVGEKEIDPLKGRISLKSPIGTALAGKKAGELVEVQAPRGTIVYEILEVNYN